MNIESVFDPKTHTVTHLVWDSDTKDAVVIDPVLEYDPVGSQTSTASAQRLVDIIVARGLNVHWIFETHAHADHLSSSQFLKNKLGAKIAIGSGITVVQDTFKGLFDMGKDFATDGSQFDRLLHDGETLDAGSLAIGVIHTPGHTPACVSYTIDDAVFTGDALLMHDFGTGRCDFPRGDAADMYRSVHDKLYALPDSTRVFVGHDYPAQGRDATWETTIGASKRSNPQIKADTKQEEFVQFRRARDQTLAAPKLLFQSVQVNINAGRLPTPQPNGVRYLKLPLSLFNPVDDFGTPTTDSAG